MTDMTKMPGNIKQLTITIFEVPNTQINRLRASKYISTPNGFMLYIINIVRI